MNEKECNAYSNITSTLKVKEIVLCEAQKNPEDTVLSEIS